ncbi:hypothetical protein BCD48_40510 [Pseudofrankia sp. BMG5.36]|nr:hypothetical protein BCD48_40510 [Pseudofrankia sp. BMG5.36]
MVGSSRGRAAGARQHCPEESMAAAGVGGRGWGYARKKWAATVAGRQELIRAITCQTLPGLQATARHGARSYRVPGAASSPAWRSDLGDVTQAMEQSITAFERGRG